MRLRCRVVQAVDLPKMGFLSLTDPYVVLRLSSSPTESVTRVCENTLSPLWDEEFSFNIANAMAETLWLCMKDRDIFDQNKTLSKLEVRLNNLPLGSSVDTWYQMSPCNNKGKGGRIRLILQLRQVQPSYPYCAPPPPPQYQYFYPPAYPYQVPGQYPVPYPYPPPSISAPSSPIPPPAAFYANYPPMQEVIPQIVPEKKDEKAGPKKESIPSHRL